MKRDEAKFFIADDFITEDIDAAAKAYRICQLYEREKLQRAYKRLRQSFADQASRVLRKHRHALRMTEMKRAEEE